jgi:murein DD-endopeptidase MepM/ murein hydrolase activator NlpD
MIKRFFICLWLLAMPAMANTLIKQLPSTLSQGSVGVGNAEVGSTVTIQDKPIPVTKNGIFLIAVGRDQVKPVNITVVKSGVQETRSIAIRQKKWNIQHIKGLPPKMVTPDPALEKRIAEDNRLIKQARSKITLTPYFLKGFIPPAKGRISGVFGSQRILNGKPKSPHHGVDYAAPTGTPVIAPAPGIITLVEADLYYTGGTVIMDHGFGLYSIFIHLNSASVTTGQVLQQGEVLGTIGSTGRATGPHLHWGTMLNGVHIDPLSVLSMALPTP